MDHDIQLSDNYLFSSLTAYLSEAEAISAIINIFDNSIFWLGYARTTPAKIDIFITDQIEGYNSIIIGDNGPGFNISADAAVKPFVSGKPFNYGMGLGLHVVKETMNELRGKLLILDKDEIELPEYMEQNKTYSALIALCFPKIK
jgi:phosphoglycerate-specific signal transduction histidine kinase